MVAMCESLDDFQNLAGSICSLSCTEEFPFFSEVDACPFGFAIAGVFSSALKTENPDQHQVTAFSWLQK